MVNKRIPKKKSGNLFFGLPIPGTCEPYPVKSQSPCIADNCGRDKQQTNKSLFLTNFLQ